MAGHLLMLQDGIPTKIPIGYDSTAGLDLGAVDFDLGSGDLDLSGVGSFTWPSAGLPMGGVRITGVGAPLNDEDVATKLYVDTAIEGLSWRQPVAVFNMLSNADQGGSPPTGPTQGDAYVVDNWGGTYTDGDVIVWTGSAWAIVVPNSGGEPPNGLIVLIAGDHGVAAGNFTGYEFNTATYSTTTHTWSMEVPKDGEARLVYGDNDVYADRCYVFNGTLWVQFSGGGLVAHAITHENGGSDEIDVTDLSGKLADLQDAGWLQGNPVDTAAPNSGDVLTWDGSQWTPQASGGGSSFDRTYNTSGTVNVRDAVYISGADTVSQADASDVDKMPAIGFVVSVGSGTCVVRDGGSLTGFSGLTVGHSYYVDATTPGAITDVPPEPGVINQCCIAVATDEIRIHIDLDYTYAPA